MNCRHHNLIERSDNEFLSTDYPPICTREQLVDKSNDPMNSRCLFASQAELFTVSPVSKTDL